MSDKVTSAAPRTYPAGQVNGTEEVIVRYCEVEECEQQPDHLVITFVAVDGTRLLPFASAMNNRTRVRIAQDTVPPVGARYFLVFRRDHGTSSLEPYTIKGVVPVELR